MPACANNRIQIVKIAEKVKKHDTKLAELLMFDSVYAGLALLLTTFARKKADLLPLVHSEKQGFTMCIAHQEHIKQLSHFLLSGASCRLPGSSCKEFGNFLFLSHARL